MEAFRDAAFARRLVLQLKEAHRIFVRDLASACNGDEWLHGLYRHVKPWLIGLLEQYLRESDPKKAAATANIAQLARYRFPDKVGFYRGFSNELAHLIEAGADMFLMPSRYEPCGLNQMYSLRYGTLPIVRATGGLRPGAPALLGFYPAGPTLLSRLLAAVVTRRRPHPCVQALLAVQRR